MGYSNGSNPHYASEAAVAHERAESYRARADEALRRAGDREAGVLVLLAISEQLAALVALVAERCPALGADEQG